MPGTVLSALQPMILSKPQAIGYYYYVPFANEDPGLMEVDLSHSQKMQKLGFEPRSFFSFSFFFKK